MMDITWVTDQIGVGGGIWSAENMAEVVGSGVTHIIDMQIEFDDRPLAAGHAVAILWNPTDDDFQPKPAELLQRGVEFALDALEDSKSKIYVHCAAGVHRAPMMTLAILGATGWKLDEAMGMIVTKRPVVDFADVYVDSVKAYLQDVEAKVQG